MIRFAHPEYLYLLLLVPAFYLWSRILGGDADSHQHTSSFERTGAGAGAE